MKPSDHHETGWTWKKKHTLLMLLGLGGVWLDHSTDLLALMAGGSLIALLVMLKKEEKALRIPPRLYLFFLTCLLSLIWLPLDTLGESRLILPLSAWLLGVLIDLPDPKENDPFFRGESLNLLLALLASVGFVTGGDSATLLLAAAPYLLTTLRAPWTIHERGPQRLWTLARILAIGFLFNALWMESPLPTAPYLKWLTGIVVALGLLLIRKHPARGTLFRT